jgi:hypothetical protein
VAEARTHERGLLDTSAVIDLLAIDPSQLPAESAISTLTLAELAAGPHATNDAAERARRQQRLQWAEATFDPLPFDLGAARAFSLVFAATRRSGRRSRRRGRRFLSEAFTFSLPAVFSFTSIALFPGAMHPPAGAGPQTKGRVVVVVVVGGAGQSESAGQSASPSPSLSRPTESTSEVMSSSALEQGSVRLLHAGA